MTKVVFISYSHDSEEHKVWVRKLADDLSALGDVEILLDQYMPKGYSFTRFMELGLSKADKVLVIGTPQYKQKAETGKGGGAFEESRKQFRQRLFTEHIIDRYGAKGI